MPNKSSRRTGWVSFCFVNKFVVYIYWKTVNKQLTTFKCLLIFMAQFAQFLPPDLLFLCFHYYSCDVGGWILLRMEITVGSFVDNFQRYLLQLDQIHQTIDCHTRHYKSAKVGIFFLSIIHFKNVSMYLFIVNKQLINLPVELYRWLHPTLLQVAQHYLGWTDLAMHAFLHLKK